MKTTFRTVSFALAALAAVALVTLPSRAQDKAPAPAKPEAAKAIPNDPLDCFTGWGKVSLVANSIISASNASGQETITFTVLRTAEWRNLNTGQAVWVNPVQKKAMFVIFPIKSTRKDTTGDNQFMETEIVVSSPPDESTGRIEGETSTRSKEALRGFKGGVVVALLDDQKKVLYRTTLRKFEVNGAAVPFGSGDRRDEWVEQNIDKNILANTRSVAIVHLDSGKNQLEDFVKQTDEVVQLAATGVKDYKQASVVTAPRPITPPSSR